MKPFTTQPLVTILLAICLTSCGKKDNTQPKTTDVGSQNNTIPDKLSSSYNKRIKLWKNGTETSLADGSRNSSGNSVFVVGNDVYVAGYDDNGTTTIAKLWKNGSAIALSNSKIATEANSVYVSGNDVYVVGDENALGYHTAKLWKNGVPVALTDSEADAAAYSVYVVNNDVYVAGYRNNNAGSLSIRVATLWKNGIATTLSNLPSSATSVYVKGNDVYVAGEEHPEGDIIVRIWKNGIALPTTDNFKNSTINSINVSDSGDIYTAGRQIKHLTPRDVGFASLWKNNDLTYLTDITKDGIANSVYVADNNVYVAGNDYTGTKVTITGNYTANEFGYYIAKVWKNGIGTALTDGTKQAGANSVFVSGNNIYVTGWESDR